VIAAKYHPGWDYCKFGAKKLHSRNVHQILGQNLDSPTKFVVGWTPDGATTVTTNKTGGTGQAIRIAVGYGVEVFNLQREDHFQYWSELINA
jgi:hypothetical protein